MLANDKLEFFNKKLFSILCDKRKFKLIKYNKYFQNIFKINLIDYKRLSGKYIIYKSEEKGKEYDGFRKCLLYEGEFLNGERNGEGKEYEYSDKGNDISLHLIFEGEYLKGKRNGKGKEYYHNGTLKFIGEYKSGNKWDGKEYDTKGNLLFELKQGKGFIKEYYRNEKLKYEGDYLNGKGKEYSYISGTLEYEGEFLDGKRNGQGKEYDAGRLEFEGEYKNGKKWTGKGYDLNNNLVYELKEGKGFVKEYHCNHCNGREISEGEYINGEKNGKFIEYDVYGNLFFEGEYLNGKKNGQGKEYSHEYLIFEGEYYNNNRLKGKEFYYKNYLAKYEGKLYTTSSKEFYYKRLSVEYEGEYLCDKKWNGIGFDMDGNKIYELVNGNGKVREYTNGFLSFEGEYLNSEKNGKGKLYFFSHLIYDGEFLNGNFNGKGKVFDMKGNLEFEGEFLNSPS